MYQIQDSHVKAAAIVVLKNGSKLAPSSPAPVCKLVGKSLDKWVIVDEVVRSLCRIGRDRDAGLFKSWGEDSKVTLQEVLAEAVRLCQVY